MAFTFGSSARAATIKSEQKIPAQEQPFYEQTAKVVLIPITAIAPNQNQPRSRYGEADIEELAKSIAENGLLQPVSVRATKNGEKPFELVAGHRRWLAVNCLGREYIEAIVTEMDSHDSAIMAMVENIQRKDLSFFDEAKAMTELMTKWGMSQQELAKSLGKSQPTVANKLRLLRLPTQVKNAIMQNNLSERHARAILRLESERDMLLATMLIVRRGLNVGQTEKYIDSLLAPKKAEPTKIVILKDYKLFLNTIKRAVDTMASAGIEIDAQKSEDDEFIRYNINIPKSKVLKAQPAAQSSEQVKKD